MNWPNTVSNTSAAAPSVAGRGRRTSIPAASPDGVESAITASHGVHASSSKAVSFSPSETSPARSRGSSGAVNRPRGVNMWVPGSRSWRSSSVPSNDHQVSWSGPARTRWKPAINGSREPLGPALAEPDPAQRQDPAARRARLGHVLIGPVENDRGESGRDRADTPAPARRAVPSTDDVRLLGPPGTGLVEQAAAQLVAQGKHLHRMATGRIPPADDRAHLRDCKRHSCARETRRLWQWRRKPGSSKVCGPRAGAARPAGRCTSCTLKSCWLRCSTPWSSARVSIPPRSTTSWWATPKTPATTARASAGCRRCTPAGRSPPRA